MQQGGAGVVDRKITIGVCVMEKKVFSAPMGQIMDRLQAFGEFEIIHFGDKVILDDPVESWPVCDCLIAFHSSGYPLEKVQAYSSLRKPFLVNELDPQYLLHDRRKVYEHLEMYGIPVPRYACVNRTEPNQDLDYFVEEEDFIEVNGEVFWKPFVEKPVNGELSSSRIFDLSILVDCLFCGIMIYYPSSAGGGMKELFRKVGNRSSEFHPDVRRVRREGSYIYEEFMPTGGTDVKVYTVGPEYAHAEARKSPVVDGVVMRNPDGKEVRYPVLLTPAEKQMAREVCIAFRQSVCGFDLLRSEGSSYVCDVNGWSFVKNSYKYYDDAACVLRNMFFDAKAPHLSSTIPPILPWKINEPVQSNEGLTRQGSGVIGTFGQSEELRCVIAVVRHGDRTPKQKVKLKVTEEKLLNLMLKYNGGKPRAETKLKTAVQLQDLLDATRMLIPRSRPGESDSDAEDLEHADKLRQVKAVLEEGGHFSGIYRKVQLKPLKWDKVTKSDGDGEEERPVEALMILKYGGVLTHAGRQQAEELGRYFRNNMYPGEGTGLLRLHSTYRHDLKIYSSDEGRVQMSAAAFAKGLLDLEGQLTPILVSLVSKDSSMLDGLDTASSEMEEAKTQLNEIITAGTKLVHDYVSSESPWMIDGVGLPPQANESLPELVKLAKKVTEQVRLLAKDEEENPTEPSAYDVVPPYDQAKALGKSNIDVGRIAAGLPCGSEGFLLMYARWRKLEKELYNERRDRFDITQIPDVYDSCKYDLLHNSHLNLKGLDELFKVAQLLADGVIPNEYGINPQQKLKIGSKIARRLLGKILIDLRNTREEAMSVAELKKSQDQVSVSLCSPRKEDRCSQPKLFIKSDELRRPNTGENKDDDEDKETKYRLDPKYANVMTPERHVRTRLYFTSESHIHSLMNVLRYCNLDESLQGEEGLVCQSALERLYLSPLEKNDEEAESLLREHTLPIMGPERLQEVSSCLTLETMEKMIRPFAMPAEDFPPASIPAGFSGYFSKSAAVLERLTKGEKTQHISTRKMGLDDTDAVKAKGNLQSNESESHKRKKNNSKGEEEEREGSGCWLNLRFMFGCVPSKPDVDGVSSASSSLYATTCPTVESKQANEKPNDQPVSSTTTTTTSNAGSSSSTPMISEELKVYSNLTKFTFNDLKLATRNFRPESLLGEGGFGCVFKGWIQEHGTAPVKPGTGLTVAVKTLNPDGLQGHKEWLAEINFLGNLLHPNLVKLVGYCIEDDQRLLVYEFMPRGSLENHLFRRSLPLPWCIRMKIAVGAAKGLSFLHEEALKPVIYRDFKTSNILLDSDYNAKLSDFGLAKDAPDEGKTHVSTHSDVYSFGVVLLEMLTGRRSMDKNRPNGEHNLVEWARPHLLDKRRFYKLLDPRLEGHFSIKGAQKVIQLAAQCLSRDPKVRPKMSDVVEALKPLPHLKDMASSSYYFQTMQAERLKNGLGRSQGFGSRKGQPQPPQPVFRTMSSPHGASPYRPQIPSPKPKGATT
ncbi:hypothetical protein HID58_039162 [Brassica napus]|uniref:Inositol hexakisphosphate and diphosphoinositol-pentakisphosphate kinase n=1 Tax=Brassica napus TaxID=3708 RepID=A0ABQ8BR80_BRANA|nr:hypothetical protein HID58_039162 [Brassica napus]